MNSKQPTIAETLKAIKMLGNVTASYSSEYKEFTVKPLWLAHRDAWYFTDDRGDALMTAVKMSESQGR